MRPPGPSISYTDPVPSGPTVSTSRDPSPGIQRFYQDFKLPNYPLDTFSGKLFDVAFEVQLLSPAIHKHNFTMLLLGYIFFALFI